MRPLGRRRFPPSVVSVNRDRRGRCTRGSPRPGDVALETVGIRELKSGLSRYLKRVRAGARVTVTERGRGLRQCAPCRVPAPGTCCRQGGGAVLVFRRPPDACDAHRASDAPASRALKASRSRAVCRRAD
ncbi:MAG: type II toxin-antitoxin system prevent-host-death family antitoxin [Acidobacteriota bacterium]|nr:type II toxin-antitoxin system prevent-host-death family antitoxin [Acidobacteriota bacterium]